MTTAADLKTSLIASADGLFERRWRKRALLAAFIWFFFCLLYGAPASLFAALLRVSVPQLQLHNVSGSFWHGRAAQAFWLQNEGQVIALGTFDWRLQPWSLLWLHPSAHVATSYGEQFVDARVRISPLGKLTLTQTSAALPASLLSSFAPLSARGQIALKLERAELSRRQVSALQGALYWQQAQWQWGSRWLALGDYRCDLTLSTAQQLHCALQGQGALALDGMVDVDTAAHAWSLQLQVQAAASLPEEFRQSLQLMLAAQPDAQGKFAVRRSGKW